MLQLYLWTPTVDFVRSRVFVLPVVIDKVKELMSDSGWMEQRNVGLGVAHEKDQWQRKRFLLLRAGEVVIVERQVRSSPMKLSTTGKIAGEWEI